MVNRLIIEDPHYVAIWERVQAALSNCEISVSFQAALSGTAFKKLIHEALNGLDQNGSALIQETNQIIFDSLVAARKGDLDCANSLLTKAEANLVSVTCGCKGRDFAVSSFHAARAYKLYKQDQFEAAVDELARSNDADLRLISDDFGFMHLHRIQLVHNRARIEFQRGQRGTAVNLMARIVKHISGEGIGISELIGPWSRNETDTCEPDLLAAMLCQVLRELRVWSRPI